MKELLSNPPSLQARSTPGAPEGEDGPLCRPLWRSGPAGPTCTHPAPHPSSPLPRPQAAELDFREENEYGAAAGDDIDGEAGADAGTGAGADLHADGEAETEVSPYSPAPSVAEVPEEVARLLASLNLEHFGPALAGPAIGVEWIADLALLRVEDLCSPGRGVGMSVVQARRLLKEAASLEKVRAQTTGESCLN